MDTDDVILPQSYVRHVHTDAGRALLPLLHSGRATPIPFFDVLIPLSGLKSIILD